MGLCRDGDSLERCALRWRQALKRREKEARDLLLQQYSEVYRWMRDELTALLKDIEAEQGEVSLGKLWRVQRYQALLTQIEAEMTRLGMMAAGEAERAQEEAVRMAEEAALEMLTSAGVGVSFTALPQEAFQALVGVLADGTPLAEHFLQTVTPEALQALRQALTAGLAAGWNPRRVARWAAQKATGLGLARALTIARTEMLRAYREGARMRYAEDGVEEWIWVSARDRRTCPACLALHGQRFKVEEPQRGHPNCRCTMVPVIPGVDYGIGSGEEWLREQPPEVQEAILGKRGAEWFREGVVKLDDFLAFRDSERWGGMYVARSQKDILARLWREREALLKQGRIVPVETIPDAILRRIGVRIEGNRTVVLTAKRRLHYLERHPEVVKWEALFPKVIRKPDEVHRNREDPQIFNFYKRIDAEHYLRLTVVVQEKAGRFKHSIITVRIARLGEVHRSRDLKIWP